MIQDSFSMILIHLSMENVYVYSQTGQIIQIRQLIESFTVLGNF